MLIRRLVPSALVAVSLIAGQLATAATASANDYRRFAQPNHGPRHVEPRRSYDYGQHKRRDRTGEAVAGVVLGIGALIVGAAIADAARNKHRNYD